MKPWESYRVSVPSKWVLTGEHAVLQGAMAVALPSHKYQLTLEFIPAKFESEKSFSVQSELLEQKAEFAHAALGIEFVSDLIQEVVKMCAIQEKFENPAGTLLIRSTIPIGAGLGSSAALCVAIVSWLAQPFGIPSEDLMDFATQLEHRFHGKSSGMDVAVIVAAEPITFTMKEGLRKLAVQKLPRFTLHDTGLRSRTSDCIAKVDDFRKIHQTAAKRIDVQMAQASQQAKEGLMEFGVGHETNGLALIVQAMQGAQRCFKEWGLLPESVCVLEQKLLSEGARAVKLTGAGGGGMVVALWDS